MQFEQCEQLHKWFVMIAFAIHFDWNDAQFTFLIN